MRNHPRSIIIVSILLLAITNVSFGLGASTAALPPDPVPPPIKAILKTSDNRPISVNGANALSGATVLTGATIETPDQVSAVISLSPAADLEIEPGSKIVLEFDENGNMKVRVIRGCATARTKKNVIAEFSTEQGVAGSTDPKSRKNMTVCYPPGASAPIISIPAGASAIQSGGLIKVLIGGISAGVITALFLRGDNPSPSSP